MYIKLETGNIRLVVKHETSVDRSMSHLPPANCLCELFFLENELMSNLPMQSSVLKGHLFLVMS
jgi:hypothetical protein